MARRELTGVAGFEPPTWREMAAGTRAPEREPEDFEPGWVRGWQHEAASRVHRDFREMDLFPRMNESSRALVRSQAGPEGGVALSTCPTCRLTKLELQVFRVLLLHRLQMPLLLTVRNCRCGHFLGVFGHHRAACARAGVLGKRGFQIGRMHDDSKWLLMACHCTAEHSWQWMQPSLAPSTGTGRQSGALLKLTCRAARRRKERRYPELVGRELERDWCFLGLRLLVVGQKKFVGLRQEGWLFQRRAEQAWRLRCLFSGTGCRRVMVGTSPCIRCRWGHATRTRCGAGLPTRGSRALNQVATFVVRWTCM